MEKNVVNKPFVADYVKALRCAFQFYSTNQVYFKEEDVNHSEYGWVRETKAGDLLICFDEQTLGKYIDKDLGSGRYAAAVKEWQDKGIINVRTIKDKDKKTGEEKTRTIKTVQIKVRGVNTTVLQIPIGKFYEHLNMSLDENPIDPINNNPDDGSNYNRSYAVGHHHTVFNNLLPI